MPNTLYNTSESVPEDLAKMLKSLRDADEIYKPSTFWDRLAQEHVMQLETEGFENFKRTINLRYFNWGMLGIFAQHILPLGWWWLTTKRENLRRADLIAARVIGESGNDSFLNKIKARVYALHVALLYQRVLQDDEAEVFKKCSEPLIGNPIQVRIDDEVVVTQDLCNSVHEYIRASQFTDMSKSPLHILEIGAGYGRVATVFLEANPSLKYWIVDIPPALYVSQRYLSEVFPGKKIFKFRPFEQFSDVESEVEDSDICFFMSNQIEMLPQKTIDITICISNLHEMTKDQIHHYFKQIDRLTHGTFYTKQWMRSIAKENGFTISRDEYPVPSHWTQQFNVRHPIQSWFFEAGYDIK